MTAVAEKPRSVTTQVSAPRFTVLKPVSYRRSVYGGFIKKTADGQSARLKCGKPQEDGSIVVTVEMG